MRKKLTTLLMSTIVFSSIQGCAENIKENFKEEANYTKVERSYITSARARWISRDIITWNVANNDNYAKFFLHYSPYADIIKKNNKISGGKTVPLEVVGVIDENDPLYKKYPYLLGHLKLSTAGIEQEQLKPEILRSNIVISAKNSEDQFVDATQIQNYGVLDDIYNYTKEDLGLTFDKNNNPTLKVWAPTAKSVRLLIFNSPDSVLPDKVRRMKEQINEGVWSFTGTDEWVGKYYLYEVQVYSPISGTVETNLVTDPYSVSLAINSKKSQIINLEDKTLKPEGWDTLKKPELKSFTDANIYELHVRDFSTKDETINYQYQGKYMAFTEKTSNGMNHLRELAKSGITHVHLLPVADIASIEEDENLRKTMPPSSKYEDSLKTAQKEVEKIKDKDAYNWGYDPFHYATPEGSYATEPNGSKRILEFRQMVKSLNDEGLRIIMDVVYNHTAEAGNNAKSVLDKIVPTYYYRLDEQGKHQNSTCCPDTASEHKMMEKLIADTLKIWAKHYKIDGFRFDLMGHHTTENMKKIRTTLDTLDPSLDGVDGKKIYLYGEGWKFGSLNNIYPKLAMHQENAYGLGVGTFNDRIRDSIRGGNFSHDTKSDQGFATGLYYDFNNNFENVETSSNLEAQKKN